MGTYQTLWSDAGIGDGGTVYGNFNFQIDLSTKDLKFDDNSSYSFDVKDSLIDRIINNLDDVDITLKHKSEIEIFEQTRRNQRPWLFDYSN